MQNRGGPFRGDTGRGVRDPRQSRQDQATLEELWPKYLVGGYFDDAGNLRIELVSRTKVEPLIREMAQSASPQLKTHQIRRFFQHCRAIESRLRSHRTSWEQEVAEFKKIDAAAADAAGKKPPKIPHLFHEFIRHNANAVGREKDFLRGFLPHFEALVGFGAQYLTDDRGRS